MGSNTGNGWWKRLFQRNDGSLRKKWNAKLGGYPNDPFSGQADIGLGPYVTSMHNEMLDIDITIQYVCSCSQPVYRLSEDNNFSCPHCDRHCEVGIPDCAYCNYAVMDKSHQEEHYEDEDEQD